MPIADHLKTVPLFQGMTDQALEAVAGLANEIRFVDGQTVTVEGAPRPFFCCFVRSPPPPAPGRDEKSLPPAPSSARLRG